MNDYEITKERIISFAKRLRLPYLGDFEGVIKEGAPFCENLCELLEMAMAKRMEKSMARRIGLANLKLGKNFDTFIATSEVLPHVDADMFQRLRNCSFIEAKMDSLLIGPVGRGKSHLANAVGLEALRKGYKVMFVVAEKMLISMHEAKEKKHLYNLITDLKNYDLLIIDELGRSPYGPEASNMLFSVVRERYENASTIITTNCELSQWKNFMSDEQLLMATMDRLIHHSLMLNMNGPESFRRKEAKAGMKAFCPLPNKA